MWIVHASSAAHSGSSPSHQAANTSGGTGIWVYRHVRVAIGRPQQLVIAHRLAVQRLGRRPIVRRPIRHVVKCRVGHLRGLLSDGDALPFARGYVPLVGLGRVYARMLARRFAAAASAARSSSASPRRGRVQSQWDSGSAAQFCPQTGHSPQGHPAEQPPSSICHRLPRITGHPSPVHPGQAARLAVAHPRLDHDVQQ